MNTTPRPTPRTEAHIRENVGNGTRYSDLASFACELEREVESKHGYWMFELRRTSELEKQNEALRAAIQETLMENLHLADGDVCTLKRLKDAIGFSLPKNPLPAESVTQ